LKIAVKENPSSGNNWIYIPHFFDLNRVHELLRKWGIGEQCRLSVKKQDFNSPEHAIFYISKYLIKMPKKGFPEWMLKTPRLRFMGSSRTIGKLVSDEVEIKKEKKKEIEKKEYQVKMPFERIAECENNLVFMQYDTRLDKNVYIGSCNAPKAAVLLTPWAIKFKDFDFRTGDEFEVSGFKNESETRAFIDLWKEKDMQALVKEKMERDKNNLIVKWKMH